MRSLLRNITQVVAQRLLAIEVRSWRRKKLARGLQVFGDRFGPNVETLVVGTGGVSVEALLTGDARI